MGIRSRKPEDTMLHLPKGDWIVVKKHLTYGDRQEIFRRMWVSAENGSAKLDTAMSYGNLNLTLQYVLDWSISDAEGKPIKVQNSQGQPDPMRILAALQDLDGEDVKTIMDAVTAHDAAMEQERAAAKNVPAGESGSPATSALPA